MVLRLTIPKGIVSSNPRHLEAVLTEVEQLFCSMGKTNQGNYRDKVED